MTSASNTPGVAVQDTALLQASASAPGKVRPIDTASAAHCNPSSVCSRSSCSGSMPSSMATGPSQRRSPICEFTWMWSVVCLRVARTRAQAVSAGATLVARHTHTSTHPTFLTCAESHRGQRRSSFLPGRFEVRSHGAATAASHIQRRRHGRASRRSRR